MKGNKYNTAVHAALVQPLTSQESPMGLVPTDGCSVAACNTDGLPEICLSVPCKSVTKLSQHIFHIIIDFDYI